MRFAGSIAAVLLSLSCVGKVQNRPATSNVVIVSINDTYRIEGISSAGVGGLARVRALRMEVESGGASALMLHAGDLLQPSLLSRQFGGEQMIDTINRLDGRSEQTDPYTFVTFGNHEFDRRHLADAQWLRGIVDGSEFQWLSSNIEFSAGSGLDEFDFSGRLVEIEGVQVGLFGLTTDAQGAAYIEGFRSPVEVAEEEVARLRELGAQWVVALTHLSLQEDVEILEQLGALGPDLVLGGHEHARASVEVGGRWVLKADAEAISALVVQLVTSGAGERQVEWRYADLGSDAPEEPELKASIDAWIDAYELAACPQLGCTDEVLGSTSVFLDSHESRLRRYETNFGDWIADLLRQQFEPEWGDGDVPLLAAINSGALRTNGNFEAGAELRERDVAEIFAFPTVMKLLEVDGATVRQVLEHSVSDWTGSGHWLQLSNIAFRHDVLGGSVSQVSLLHDGQWRPLDDAETVHLALLEYLVDPTGSQDGYTMLNPSQVVATLGELDDVVRSALRTQSPIAPLLHGRICSSDEPDLVCLTVERAVGP
jgi:2',3'-cyclic-nucleotide 2'-phosphodiesterase (5'-nucleotidase family)